MTEKILLWGKDDLSILEKNAGGKATNMARLEKCGVSVPPWFCVSNNAFEHFLLSIENTYDKPKLWNLSHEQVEKIFIEAPLPEEIKKAVVDGLAQMNLPSGVSYAVRSSGVGEDSAEHSFAGQFSSYLHQKNIDQILASLKLCWASAFTERARVYRQERKISTTHFKMGVVIQKMLHADVAGVAFSRDPIHPMDRDQLVVSSVWGLGEGLVSGELDADHFHVHRENFAILPQLVQKDFMYVGESNGGIKKIAVPDLRKNQSSLTDSEVKVVAQNVLLLEKSLGLAQDMEFVFEADKFYCVQTRPITSLPPDSFFNNKLKGDRYILWDNSNITESYNGVTSPLTFSYISRSYRQVYVQFCLLLSVPPQIVEEHEPTFRNMLGHIRGRVYYNLGNWYQMLYLFPFAATSKGMMETMMGVKQGLKPEIAKLFEFTNAPEYSFKKKVVHLFRMLYRIFYIKKIVDEFKVDFYKIYNKAKKEDFSQYSMGELIDYLNYLDNNLLFKWKAPIISDTRCMIFFGTLKSLTGKWVNAKEAGSIYNDLLSGQEDIPSTEPTKRLMRIAGRVVKGDPKIKNWIISTPCAEVWEKLQKGFAPDLYKDLMEYLDLYGFRCIDELKFEARDLHDDPRFTIEAIISFVRMNNVDVEGMVAREKAGREKAEVQIRKELKGLKLKFYMFILRHARLAVKDREDLRFLRTNIFGIVRRIFRAMGKNLKALDVINDAEDVFYLTIEEIVAYSEGRSALANLKETIRIRSEEYNLYRETAAPPDRFVSQGMASLTSMHLQVLADSDILAKEAPKSDDPNVLLGTSCCPGIVEGIVRVIRNAEDAVGLNGEIMVSERTDPGWVPLFPSTSGLLIERGSLLSHSAVVARELGIPTIVGIHGGLMKRLKTGMRVRMDAARGEVRILD
ncbi:MAG: PEP/pyruvate-binding domain-containing protein [Bacteriovoracaceae bacterium]